MRKSEYPDRISKMKEYTAGDISILYGVAHRTACRLIDEWIIQGYRLPGVNGKPGERRVLHSNLMNHARGNRGNFKYVLTKIDGLTPEEMTLEV
jgi:hypothetical protein